MRSEKRIFKCKFKFFHKRKKERALVLKQLIILIHLNRK